MDRNSALLKEYKNGNTAVRDMLCSENMGLVQTVVKRFAQNGTETEDLIQTGTIGLLKAIDNFDISYNVKFSTYAVPMILGEIRRFLRDDGIIKISRSVKQAAYKGYKAREELAGYLKREPTIEEISNKSGVPVENLIEAFEATAAPDSINREVYAESNEELGSMLADNCDEEKILNKIAVSEILDKLTPRERRIIVLRYFNGKTQQEIAAVIGVSQVQVSRIEKQVLEKIRKSECY